MKQMFTSLLLGSFLLGSESLLAQDGGFGRGSRGDRGGDRGDRGGDRGGDMGGRGFGGFGGGPPGGFGGGGPGGFGGGPPGGFGGFGGGGPGGFGGFGGGPPGGFGGFGGGPPGGGDSDRGSRFTSMMDSNGNGKIDQEELDRMPSFVRDMMKARGIELKPGMSLDDMRNSFRSGFSGGPPGSPQNPGQPGENGNNKPKALAPYRMKPKKPMTLELPPAYAEVDTDFDGQLGMHEWMMTRRADLEQFEAMDLDFDGFLIPEELQAAEAAAAAGQNVASTDERKRLTIVTGTPARPKNAPQSDNGRGDRGGDQQRSDGRSQWGGGNWGGGQPGGEAAMAPSYFQRLDQNQNGRVDPEEWEQSRRVRGMFEQAGIRLDAMDLATFTKNLEKASAAAGQQQGGR